ncbi:NAD-glutamate dehydrogenase [Actinocorallia sp. API 0066]|uniref:NAD-glutamate dehydrogenase n=1 Tax=Actinocorallia sp. API 0066 TaxID=2896846 RepID=UPI001E3755CB|nr:NAD-glutamate dehydrogenase [Actinocorallia sp. API 0066]MCD0451240.1 NAD-glutamate dehydrogenase [Actinocorallia sp. API 0066]
MKGSLPTMGTLDEAKDDLLVRAARTCAKPHEQEQVLDFLRLYYRQVSPEDLLTRDPADVCGPALGHRHFGERRKPGQTLLRVFTPGLEEYGWDPGHSVVQAVTDDMPYLIDSLTMELSRHGLAVHLIVHPLMGVDRDADGRLVNFRHSRDILDDVDESWLHIEIDRTTDPEALAELRADLERVLKDVYMADEDEPMMQSFAGQIALEVRENPPPLPEKEIAEGVELLDWLADGHFTFLGYRDYSLSEDGSTLIPVSGTGLGILREEKKESRSFAAMPPEVRARAREPKMLILTKANSRATVHRPHYLDYIGVKRFEGGEVVGESRFLGLFTHVAYSESISHIPVLKRKLDEVLQRAEVTPESYDGQDLIEILEDYPRDELFQTSVDDLVRISTGVLRLRDRRRLKLFLRKDDYGRYMSCMVYLPRDKYTTQIRLRLQEILRRAFNGVAVDYSAQVTEGQLARLHIVVRGERGKPLPDVDPDELETRLAAATRSWSDDLAEAIVSQVGEEPARALSAAYGDAFPEAYKADFPARTAVADLRRLDALDDDVATTMSLYEPYEAAPGEVRLKIYHRGEPISLSRMLPMLQHMGVEVVDERPYEINTGDRRRFHIYDLGLRHSVTDVEESRLKGLFQDALMAAWRGEVENDGFNALVLHAGLTWQQAMIIRAYAKYLRQIGTAFTQHFIEDVLRANAPITRLLVRLWESRLSPALTEGEPERTAAISEELSGMLDEVASLDEDRILRTFFDMIRGTLRTNFWQHRRYLSLKFDPARIPELPAPRPKFEIFVYSPRVEGVHLRFGTVARGGLRWSDRREDFRTEILGLVKAQAVKNTVIVPAGAKGGFVGKRLPDPVIDRDQWLADGIACYKEFISGLLDLTDNLVDGKVVPAPDVVRHDGDDTYLVVAADKGTAAFSDIANGVAADYGFWLGDAFASGGSVGYDHKAMGITARGAWESVRYHFQSLGRDVQTEDFTVVGVGDMSGDVFGNGMLLSEHTKLVCAFDHRHVFVDPDPDPAVSFAERRRLFELPRSSWADYNTTLISEGGGVFPRSAKSIRLTPQIRAALGIHEDVAALTPFELIKAALLAPVDLLWNGGIGTYVKASTESNADVGDKANDPVRVDGGELRCKVIGEGGNLGLTQLGRIEFAKQGGLVNTDFIDNSAGVDTSDHEVNIKILLDEVVRDGELTTRQRDALLDEMTDEVGEMVLRDNYRQNVVLGTTRAQASSMMHVHARYLRKLERDGRLNRKLEALPDDKTIAERRQAGQGLFSPEIAVLLAYTKLTLDAEITASALPDDPYLADWLVEYFPTPLRERFRRYMDAHPLRREIITTQVVNDVVNNSGTTFIFRLGEETGASPADLARAYLVVREVFDLQSYWADVDALGGSVDQAAQIKLLLEARKLTERGARWLVANRRPPFDVRETIARFRDGAAKLAATLPDQLSGRDLEAFQERRDMYVARGVPVELAERSAIMVAAYSTLDLVEVAHETGRPVEEVAEVYFDLGDRLQLARLRERIFALPRDDRWRSMARGALRDDLYAAHAELARDVVVNTASGDPEARVAAWNLRNEAAVRRAAQTLTEIWESDSYDLATLSVALRAIRTLVRASTLPD